MSKLRLGLEWFLNLDHVPFEPSEHVDAIAELQAGTLDIAVTEPVYLVEDRGKGHAVTD